MKIVIDGRLYGLENAGLGRYVMSLIKNLALIDTNNEYIVLMRKKYSTQVYLPKNWKIVVADYQHYSLMEQIKLPIILANIKADLVHFPHFNVPVFYFGKFVVTIHDILMHNQKGLAATTLTPIKYFVKRIGYKFIFWNAIKRACKIIVPSNSVSREVKKAYSVTSEQITVTYEGVEENLYSPVSIKSKNTYFIYTGNAYPHKNLKRLVDTILLLNKKYDQSAKLLIVSSRNVFTKRLQKLINYSKATKYVELLGYVDDNKLTELYVNAKAFVFPSLSEGFGLPGIEALKAGTILAASDIPVFKEIYQGNAIYFDPYNEVKMADVLNSILNMQASKRIKMIESGKKYVSRFSWTNMAEKTLEVYKEVVQN